MTGVLHRILLLILCVIPPTQVDLSIRSNYDLTSTIGNATGTAVGARAWPGGQSPLLFCVSKYTKVVRIEYSSGYVTSIQMQNV